MRDDIEEFSNAIEEIVYMKDIPYIEAICLYCEENDFDIESAAKLLSSVIKSKIKTEAEHLHFIKKSTTRQLPI